MTKVTTFSEAEIAEPADFDAIGQNAREADENTANDAIGYPYHWANFAVETPSAVIARLSPGRFWKGKDVYDADDTIDVDVQTYLPVVSGDERWVAILLRGETATLTAARLVEIDAETEETEEIQLPKTAVKRVATVIVSGNVSPTPVKPTVPANECCLCFLRLTTSAIAEVVMGEAWRLKSLYEIKGRVEVIEGDVSSVTTRTESLETDNANLANQLRAVPRPEIIRQLQRDSANTRRALSFPAEARSYWYDPGLVYDQWDTAHAAWLARVREGVRFQYAGERDAQLALLNPGDSAISLWSGSLLMPAYAEKTRLEVEPTNAEQFKNISQIQHTITTAIRREISRTSISYGPTVAVCENQAEWASVGDRRAGEIFTAGGETFEVVGLVTDPNAEVDTGVINTWNPEATVADIAAWNADPQSAGHQNFAVQQVQYDTWTEVYWDYVTETVGVNGSTYAQTFLNQSPMIATSIDLYFSRVGTSGDVHLMLVDCGPTGAPDFKRVITKTTVLQANLALGWTRFAFRPTLLEAGQRYAWVTVTTGNHSLAYVTDNRFTQGTLFWSTDGDWAAGSPTEDFAFRLNAAEFVSTRTVVEFDPLTLENGMTEIRLLYEGWEAAGTALVWEIQASGQTTWQRLIPVSNNPLAGLPALCRLRATFIGTTDLAPALQLNSKARGMAYRHRTDMQAVSDEITFGFTTDEIQIDVYVDNYSAAHHTCVPKLIVGTDVIAADSVTITQDFAKLSRSRVLATFSLGAATGSARLRVDMDSDSVTFIPFIQNAALYAI